MAKTNKTKKKVKTNYLTNPGEWKAPVGLELLYDTSLSAAALKLYIIFLSYARSKNTAFPSRERLAKDMGLQVGSIDRLKKELVEHKLLIWEHRWNGENKYNWYYLPQYRPIHGMSEEETTTIQIADTCIHNKKKVSKKITKISVPELPMDSDPDSYYTDPDGNKPMKKTGSIRETQKLILDHYLTQHNLGMILTLQDKNKTIMIEAPEKFRTQLKYYSNLEKSNVKSFILRNSTEFVNRFIRNLSYMGFYISQSTGSGGFFGGDPGINPSVSLFTKTEYQVDKFMAFAEEMIIEENVSNMKHLYETPILETLESSIKLREMRDVREARRKEDLKEYAKLQAARMSPQLRVIRERQKLKVETERKTKKDLQDAIAARDVPTEIIVKMENDFKKQITFADL